MCVESEVKKQYSRIFNSFDYRPFKQTADYYFKTAALLKKKDINESTNFKLWIRNVRKRLYIGIATELLLKAVYLKEGFNINKSKKGIKIKFPIKQTAVNKNDLNENDTYTLSLLIDNLSKVFKIHNKNRVLKGLKISKVFRNKEGHIAVYWHDYNSQNYDDIEYSIKEIYTQVFKEDLTFQVSMERNEKGKFEIKNPSCPI